MRWRHDEPNATELRTGAEELRPVASRLDEVGRPSRTNQPI